MVYGAMDNPMNNDNGDNIPLGKSVIHMVIKFIIRHQGTWLTSRTV
jgi:hypothetical protein